MTQTPELLGPMTHVDALLRVIGPVAGLRIIDLGCGEGHLACALAERGAEVQGYDPFIAGTDWVQAGGGRYRLTRAAADAIPEPDAAADLVLFVFSLHHVPGAKLAGALAEARRMLRPGGRLYVAEPIAEGPNQYVMELFHDETAVRNAAIAALARHAAPNFSSERRFLYSESRRFENFDAFAAPMIRNMRFNGYTEAAVLAPDVRRRFAETFARNHGVFEQPVRINLFA